MSFRERADQATVPILDLVPPIDLTGDIPEARRTIDAARRVEDLRGLPPAYIDVGALDAFRDEDIAYAQRLLQAGVPTELHVTPGAFHASEMYNAGAETSRRIARARTESLQRVLG